MFLLDTNVVSELRRAHRANEHVASWAQRIPSTQMFLSSISILELETGALLLSRRDKKQGVLILEWIDEHVLPAFEGRIIPVDVPVARKCSTLHIPDPKPYRDSLIAATAIVHDLTLVTRNAADFGRMLPHIINPWQPSAF